MSSLSSPALKLYLEASEVRKQRWSLHACTTDTLSPAMRAAVGQFRELVRMMEAQAALKEKVIKGIRLHKVSTPAPVSRVACCPERGLSCFPAWIRSAALARCRGSCVLVRQTNRHQG